MMIKTLTEINDFAHPELGQEVTAIGGHYVFTREIRLPYNGQEILYFVGYAVLDSTCCGVSGCVYAFVPGFIKKWKYKTTQSDSFISQVAPIRDRKVQKEVQSLIQKKEMVFQVNFD
jgi:hypothetical protein